MKKQINLTFSLKTMISHFWHCFPELLQNMVLIYFEIPRSADECNQGTFFSINRKLIAHTLNKILFTIFSGPSCFLKSI